MLLPSEYKQLLNNDAAAFAGLCYVWGFKVVAFDMDQCLVSQHSRGKLKRGAELESYIGNVTPDFKATVSALAREGIYLAVATHSDEVEYGVTHPTHPATHIMGAELAERVLAAAVPQHAASFKVVAYHPTHRKDPLRDTTNAGKQHHIRLIASVKSIRRDVKLL